MEDKAEVAVEMIKEFLTAYKHKNIGAALLSDIAEIPPVIGDVMELIRAIHAFIDGRIDIALLRLVLQVSPLPQVPLLNTAIAIADDEIAANLWGGKPGIQSKLQLPPLAGR